MLMTATQREDAVKFETARIKVLQEERLYIQKKTFTKWVNSFLQKARMEVEDLFADLRDGKKLLKLLEIISGEKLGKPNHGRTRVHKIENVNKSLAFLHTKVRLESIGAEDIVDGNPRLILGLIWTIILRFQIQEIEIDVNEDDESSEKKSAKDALLLWCQRKTAGHAGVDIRDFTVSWRSGLGFNALIHSHRPDLLDYEALIPQNHIENLNHAFDVAQRELGIPRLLDAEDVDTNKPDEKSVITYVASYYHTFARMKNEMKGGRRIANIVAQMMEADKQKQSYESFTSTLLEWIQKKILELTDRNFPNSLEGIQRELLRFKEYRTIEKPLKYKERSEVEALLFGIQTKLKALGQPLYVPPEGKLVHDIERNWDQLEKAEHMREISLREELVRQEKLENLAYRFERKSVLREGYLKEMIQVLSDPRYGSNLSQVEATVKKHEAISADILAREERFHNLSVMVEELVSGNYHSKEKVKAREEEIILKWKNLLELLNKHKFTLTNFSKLINMLREVDTIIAEIQAMESSFNSDDYGRHLLSVDDLLQKHSLVEMQITSQGETIRKLNNQAQVFTTSDHKEAPRLQKKLGTLNDEYEKLQKLAKLRRSKLDESRAYFQFVQDHEEEEAWVVETQRICKTMLAGKDLLGVLSLQQKHKSLEAEIQGRWSRAQRVSKSGEQLISERHPQSKDIRQRLNDLKAKWEEVHKLAKIKQKQLEDLFEAYQYHADANEAESWMREKIPLVSSKDYGKDEPGAQALLQRHSRLDEEIHAYKDDIERLSDQADRMVKSGIANLSLLEAFPEQVDGAVNGTDDGEEWIEEVAMVPVEEWVEEIVEKEILKDVVEERQVQQVKALYAFQGQGMDMQKGEIMILNQKTNSDWWNVRRNNGRDGFVPASYVKEVDPKVVRKVTKQPVKVPEKQRVMKMVLKRQVVRKKKERSPVTRKPVKRFLSKQETSVEQRQKAINESYEQLIQFSKDRKHYLDDAIHLFGFYGECDDFESWMKDKEKMLTINDPTESVDVMKKMFENFLTDLSASSRRTDDIDKMVQEFIENNHSQLSAIKARQRQIHDRWSRLNKLKTEKERGLEGATSVELFNRTCDEARDWMLEKMDKIDIDETGRDMKTVQALQRKHQNLERELAPVEEKFNRVNLLADSVKASYPTERNNVKQRQQELKELWDKVKVKASQRRSLLDESLGLQIFKNGSKSLLAWVNQVKQALNNDEPARDVVTAENLLKTHTDLGDDIKAHQDEFHDLQELGMKLLPKSQDPTELQNTLLLLQEEQDAIHRGWQQKGDWLRQCIDLQVFNREADQIESITNSHDAYLDFHDMGTTLDDVEGLSKRHDNFINTLLAQHERLNTFSEMADKLIKARHYENKYIDERRLQVLERRQAVQDKAFQRREQLQASQSFQEFRAEADEILAWIQEKLKTAADESYRDLNNLERKLQKHEAFEAEVRANEARILGINNLGEQHMREGHYASDEITTILSELNSQWQELRSRAVDKGQKIRQAVAQHTYNRTLDDARIRLDELQNSLASNELGSDLRSIKDLLVKHQTLENELVAQEAKVEDLSRLGQEMAQEGHFDAPNIIKATHALEDRLENLKKPAANRRAKLEESLKLHQFTFEVETEMLWIREHLPSASSIDLGQSLVDVQNLSKKHVKLEREVTGHQVMIDKTLANGKLLTDQKHCASEHIQAQCQELSGVWKDLITLVAERKRKLDLSLKAQQYFSEANEVELWMTEKQDALSSTDYGKDEDASVKLLTKHKAIELEIDTYSGLVTEMGHQVQKMVDSQHPDSKVISNRMQVIQQQMRSLQKLASLRCQKLVEVKHQHEYFRESEELEQWVNEQMQHATSEDFGQDYEHLLLLLNKFNDFKLHVESSSGRLSQCRELGKKLLTQENSFSGDIEKQQEELSQAWETLLDHIEARDHKLKAAGEIHRFNRDVSEALSRIQEKYTSIPEDLGRDLHSVENMLRKHDGFENDLVALEGQLQVIIDDSVRMQSQYPGGNAENIQQQQAIILENWAELQERSAQRRSELQAAYTLQKLLTLVRTWETWAQDVCSSLQAEEKVRDLAGAQMLSAEHERLKAEIEAREEDFQDLVMEGKLLVEQDHYAKDEIEDRLAQILNLHDQLLMAWGHKKTYLDQLESLQTFLRDAKQMETISAQQEAYLSGFDIGTTTEEVTVQVKKHEAFEKLMSAQEERLSALQENGTKLIQQKHFGSNLIRKRIDEVTTRRSKAHEMCTARRQRLSDALLYAQFRRDASEAETWIDEKQKKLGVEESKMEVTSLEDKMKKLQKHQAFKAELTAHKDNIISIKQTGEQLLAKRHDAAPEIHSQLEQLLQEWNTLLEASASRGRGLEEAQDILEFNNQVEEVLAWIRDKEMMVQAGDTGNDYEHCLALQKKLNDVDSDMRVDENRIKSINALGDKLIRQGRSDTQSLQQRKEELNHKWKSLQGALENYREQLSAALEIHAFNRDVDDTDDRINEKATALSVEDESKSLLVVEALQRKQETTERDIVAIDRKLKDHDGDGRRLVQKYPEMATTIRDKLSNLQENWRRLTNLCQTRKQQLASAYTLHKFLSDLKELELWVNEISKRMTAGELANNTAEAQTMLQLHQERKAEIDGRQDVFRWLREFGHRLLQQKQTSKENLEQNLAQLEELRKNLGQVWELRRIQLDQCYNLQVFKEHAELADSWLASKEAFLNNEDLGDSMSSVEALLRKHENFEKTMSAQSDKVNQLELSAKELVSSNHYDGAAITTRCQNICQRRDRLKESALLRRKKLLQSKQLQQFLRNIYEVVGWIHEKITVASDESYRDPTNLLTKIQKHTAFDAELTANKGRVDSVISEGERLIGAAHFASSEIESQVVELQALWQQLQDHTKLKKERLSDAYQALLVSRILDDLDNWMDDMEVQLQSEDHGKDLTSVQNLLKKHLLLETDIHNHAENLEQVKDLAASFQTCDHFMKDEVEERCAVIVKRYQSLHEPMQIRRDNLEDALLLYQFYRDVDDELSWVQEKEPLAASEELGSSLTSVQNLQKKHQALESEIHAHEPLYSTVTSKGRQMIRSGHFASAEVEAKLQVLQLQMQSLKDLASVRKLRLLDALESQTFYSEVSEADTWMKEKKPLLTSTDVGKDEDSVQSLMKKLEALERDIEGFSQCMVKLSTLSQGLVERGHFDSVNIKSKQTEAEFQYEELQMLCQEREHRLQESSKFFIFLRDVDEVEAWIGDQMVIASSEDYGRDVEHVEILIQKFEGFLSSLQSNEDRVTYIRNTSRSLINEGHSQSDAIKIQSTEIAKRWRELKECAHSRQEALTGAKTVHTFDRSADETICWINEKHAALSSDDYGHDLESIQALGRYHEGFERDLAAVKEQVVMLVEEAKRLASQYPDARDHIEAKHEEVTEAWGRLLTTSANRKDKLHQAEKLQAYFDDYRELMAWANEMMALITSSELAHDVPGAEALLDRHKEHRAEIDTRLDSFARFTEQGEALITGGHFMAEDIRDRITRLNGALEQLLQTWKNRQFLYEQNLDTQQFKFEAEQLEAWLQSREPVLHDSHYGDSIAAVEELIRKHEDFQKTVEAQEDKFAALNRITKLEEAFRAQKAEEQEQKKVAVQRKEQERLDALKRKEQHRILQERKQEDERRRTQEIVFKKTDERVINIDSEMNGSTEGLSPSKNSEMPEIRPHGMMFKAASQKSLDSDRLPPPMVRVGSMRVESFTTPVKHEALSGIKRSESVKLDERQKKIKRTPSFTTRKRAVANRQRNSGELPPVEIEGVLERKQELQSGGKRATIRSWKNYYTVLCGQLLCFFKDKDSFIENNAAAPPVSLLQAKCQEAKDYTKKKHVFRIQLMDNAEFLFTAHDEQTMTDWLKKLSFHASLPPSLQLLSYDSRKDATSTDRLSQDLNSSASSQASSPESRRSSLISSHPSGSPSEKGASPPQVQPTTPQQPSREEKVVLRDKSKPPVMQRPVLSRIASEPPPPPTQNVTDGISVKSRIQMFQNVSTSQARVSLPTGTKEINQSSQYTTFTVSGHPNQNGINNVSNNNNNLNVADESSSPANSDNHHQEYYPMPSPNFPPTNYLPTGPPPLPERPPPSLSSRRAPPRMDESDEDLQYASDNEQERHYTVYRRAEAHREENYSRQSIPSSKESSPAHVTRHMSLPAKSQPPGGYLRPTTGTLDNRLRTTSSDGSSEGELHQAEKKGKKSSMFRIFKKR